MLQSSLTIKFSRNEKKQLAKHAPIRDVISTTAKIDKLKGNRNKRKLMAKFGYQENKESAEEEQGDEEEREEAGNEENEEIVENDSSENVDALNFLLGADSAEVGDDVESNKEVGDDVESNKAKKHRKRRKKNSDK